MCNLCVNFLIFEKFFRKFRGHPKRSGEISPKTL